MMRRTKMERTRLDLPRRCSFVLGTLITANSIAWEQLLGAASPTALNSNDRHSLATLAQNWPICVRIRTLQ
jgi:hypothetical protein